MLERLFKAAIVLLVIVVALFIAVGSASAQIGSVGTINGTVTDPSGAVVPGAKVVATNVATGVETTRQTNDAGLYVITPLPPGEYKITVSVSGFQTMIQEKVIVDALTTVTVNIAMKVGSVNETITVDSLPPQLNTSDPRLGTTIRNELYTALPLAMGTAVAGSGIGQGPRNPGAFIFLLPGVTEGNRWGQINGAQGFSKDVFVEGVPITDPIQQGEGRTIALGISVEAVEQFQVETSGTGVEFNGQGSENYTIKSGGNEFHGTGFEYLRNTVLDARGFFPVVRPIEHQNEYGFTFGGPILKKKLFFFTAYDGWRYRVTSPTQLVSIPSLKERAGDFSELGVNIYDPTSTVCGGAPTVCTRTQFFDPSRATPSNPTGANIIPLNRISAISNVYQSLLPLPTSAGVANNYLGQVPVSYNNDSFNLKVDYNITSNQRLLGIYTYGKRSQPGAYREVSSGVPQSALPLPYTSTRLVTEIPTVFQLKHTWSINSNLLNQLSFGFQHFFVPITNATSADKWSTKSHIQGLPAGDASDAFLEAAFAGNNSPAGWRGTDARDFEDNNYNYTIQDSVIWVRGRHSFKFGFQYQNTYDKVKNDDTGSLFVANFSNNQTAQFNANSSTLNGNTGNSFASYLLGALNTATVLEDTVSGAVPTTAQFSTTSFWVADDFKFNSKLTFNLGLRYDYMLPYTEKDDHFTFLDPFSPNPAAGGRPGVLRFGGNSAPDAISCHCSQIVNTYPNAWGPRVGFAYAWGNKTVFRGGYGIMYTRRGAVGGRENARVGSGFIGLNASPALAAPNGFDPAFYWQSGIPPFIKGPIYDQTYLTGFNAPNVTGGTLTFADPDSQPPRYQNWNLSVQRSLTSSMVLTLAYVGSNGKQLAGAGHGIWSNQIDPKYLVLGNLLNSTANPANVAAAAAILPGVALPFPTFTGTIAQMLRPFPQYGGIADPYGNVGQVNYNALQASLQQRLSHGLTFNINYTFSKAIGNIFGIRSAYKGDLDKTISNTDMPHVFNAFFSYDLPFGKGKMFDPDNSVVRAVIGGWTLSGITRYASGIPLGPFIGTCTLPQAGACYVDYNPNFSGSARINGDWGTGQVLGDSRFTTPYIDRNAFVNAPPFTYGNTPVLGAYGLRSQPFVNTDLSIARRFQIRENVRFVFGADAFNIFNAVRFAMAAGYNNITPSNNAFGKVGSQNNLPRVFQFKFRLEM
jgi:hypothetical protein